MKHFLYSLAYILGAVAQLVIYERTGIPWFAAAIVGCGVLSSIQYVRFMRTL